MVHPGRRFQDSFRTLTQINKVLQEDTALGLTQFRDAALKFRESGSQDDLEAAEFCSKAAIRAFLGQVDGLGYALRRVVVKSADEVGLTIPRRKLAELMERKYDSKADAITDEEKLLPTETSIKIGTTWFPKLLGADFALKTDGEEWRGLKRLIKIRNRFTHPETLEEFYSGPALGALLPTAVWFSGQMQDMFAECCAKLGYPQSQRQDAASRFAFKEADHPISRTFTEDVLGEIQEVAARVLKYAEIIVVRSGREIVRSLEFINNSAKPFLGHGHQYAVRTAVRSLYSEVEASIAVVLFFVNAAAKREEITLTEADREVLATREIESKLVAALTIFSREFGYNYVPVETGDLWRQFRGARFFRDRLTHPKDLDSLRVDGEAIMMHLHAAKYFNEALSAALRIDPYKFASKTKYLEKIIAEGLEDELRQLYSRGSEADGRRAKPDSPR